MEIEFKLRALVEWYVYNIRLKGIEFSLETGTNIVHAYFHQFVRKSLSNFTIFDK